MRRLWTLLDEAVGRGLPLTLAVAGPVTASGQHHAWLNPLLDSGWFCLVSTTDAVCYHDGHRALDAHRSAVDVEARSEVGMVGGPQSVHTKPEHWNEQPDSQ